MTEVYKNFFVGNENDVYEPVDSRLFCAKEPFHRQVIGYVGRALSVHNPDYYYKRIGNLLYLNLVDAEDPKYVSNIVINEALAFIDERLAAGDRLLALCNEGKSRSPSIAFLWMYERGHLPQEFGEAGRAFKSIYPDYWPGGGMFIYLRRRLCQQQTSQQL